LLPFVGEGYARGLPAGRGGADVSQQGKLPQEFFGDDQREKHGKTGQIKFDQDLYLAWPPGQKAGSANGTGEIQANGDADCTIMFEIGGARTRASGTLSRHANGKFGVGMLDIQGGGKLRVTVENPKRYSTQP
jgi:hypothetical protein